MSPVIPAPAPKLWAIVPCAGSGSRAGGPGPKQYQALAGQAMVLHTIAALKAVPRLHGVLVVVSPGDGFFSTVEAGVWVQDCGGDSRAQTVCNGLAALQTLGAAATDWVLVHDAARCLVTPAQIDTLIDACVGDRVGGLLALPLPDTLKQAYPPRPSSDLVRVESTLPRTDKWLAQTPQMFRLGRLLQAIEWAGDAVTDEASAIEATGQSPLLVQGSAQNFKVTWPEDFALAEAVLMTRRS